MKSKIICVDFDNTCVRTVKFPDKYFENTGAAETLRKLQKCGHKIILHTVRGTFKVKDGMREIGIYPTNCNALQIATDWFNDNNIELFGINENPEQREWSDSNKPFAHLYIDDSALGCPLTDDGHVNWFDVYVQLNKHGYFKESEIS